MLRTEADYKRSASAHPVEPYWDRTLRGSRHKSVRFVRALLRRGLVRLHDPRRVKGRVGVFFVHEKTAGMRRLIIDARQTNM